MKTTILICSLLLLVVLSCKKEATVIPQSPVKVSNLPAFIIDTKKPAGSLRIIVKPLCYDDLNTAYINSKKEGC